MSEIPILSQQALAVNGLERKNKKIIIETQQFLQYPFYI
jgi:hypothetical protein